jgi:hypothetical protein
MLIHQCEALAVRVFLETVGEFAAARGLRWNGSIATARDARFRRYTSEFCVRGSDGLVNRETSVPLFEDGACVQTVETLEQALLAAITETAIAVRGPVAFTPSLRPPAAYGRSTA